VSPAGKQACQSAKEQYCNPTGISRSFVCRQSPAEDKRGNPAADDNHAIHWHLKMVIFLSSIACWKNKRVNPAACENAAIRLASLKSVILSVVSRLLEDKRVEQLETIMQSKLRLKTVTFPL
jgi:hypothetical protein